MPKPKGSLYIYRIMAACFFALPWSKAWGLSCADTKQLTQTILKLHFNVHEFSRDLSKKTLTEFIKSLDPGKLYFLQSDVDEFLNKDANLPSMILQQVNCSLIGSLYDRYDKRLKEQSKVIRRLIKVKHDFTKEEYLNLDRKNLVYGKTTQELEERWRQRIKFQYMQLAETLDAKEQKNKNAVIQEKLNKRYDLLEKRQKEMKIDDVYGLFLDCFSIALDPHTDYFSSTELEEFRISTRLSLEGIGALLRSEDGFTSIISLVPGGAAAKSGQIQAGDKITAVAQGMGSPVEVIDMDLKDVVNLIRGPGGTEVRLTLRRDGKDHIVSLLREKIQLEDKAAKSKTYKVTGQDNKMTHTIGVITLPSFYMDFEGRQANNKNFRSSSKDMLAQISLLKTQGAEALILDLRGNGGGSLDEAINVAGLFSGKAPVVQIKGQEDTPYVSFFQGQSAYDGPLLVLIDRQSASASEILAGAIKDFERGLIVGDEHTFGKGTVQNLNDLDSHLGAIKVTISKFYRPLGASTQQKGVDSDILIPSLSNIYEIGEKFYESALPWSQLPKAAQVPNFHLVTPYKKELSSLSQKRIKESKKFQELSEMITKYNNTKKDEFKVSLKQKSQLEKNKEAQEKKVREEKDSKLKKDSYGNPIIPIEDDPQLMESLHIATDYIHLIKKTPPIVGMKIISKID
jgi:carboxyl-terminal processing protease